MLYVIEGADGTGKSVLARKLGKLLDCPVIYHGPTKALNCDAAYMDFVGNIASVSPCCDVVLDRFLASEFVYAYAYGRLPRCSRDFYDGLFAELDAVTIFCDPGDAVMMDNFDKQVHDAHDTADGVMRAQNLYRRLLPLPGGLFVKYDYGETTAEQLLEKIRDMKPTNKIADFGQLLSDGLRAGAEKFVAGLKDGKERKDA